MTEFADRLLGPDAPPLLRSVVDYWNAKRGTRRMPTFEDIDATEIPAALSSLYILEVTAAGEYTYRLAGTKVEEPYGRPLKGLSISDLFPPASAKIIQGRWNRVAHEPAACFTDTEHPSSRETFISAKRVVLPLGPDDGPADHVMGAAVFYRMKVEETPEINGAIIREVRWVALDGSELVSQGAAD